jgi:hypothetical protein
MTAIALAALLASVSIVATACGPDNRDSGTTGAERGVGAGAGAGSTTTMPRGGHAAP